MKFLLLVFIIILTSGLFVGGPGYYDNAIVKKLWEAGHFALFLFLSYYLFTHSRLNQIQAIKRSAIIIGVSIAVGLLTETIQLFVERNFEVTDLLNDLLGTFAGLLIPHLRFKTNPVRFALLLLLIIFLAGISNRPLFSAIAQEVKLKQDFPILSDFETPAHLKLWKTNLSKIFISSSNVRDGRFSMRVELSPGKYPGITLEHLHENWHGYQSIKLSIYLDADYPIDLAIKVYDHQHPGSGFDHDDRFNGKLSLNPGWNDFSIPLSSIESAPAKRSMDMKKVESLSLFTVHLKQSTTLYVDSVQLIKDL